MRASFAESAFQCARTKAQGHKRGRLQTVAFGGQRTDRFGLVRHCLVPVRSCLLPAISHLLAVRYSRPAGEIG